MKVSVIIPAYKAAGTIIKCLESVASQTLASSREDVEVVLVDDHGGDQTIPLAREFAQKTENLTFIFTQTPANSGPGAARNIGIKAATGDYICFLDADDTLSDDFCKKLYSAAVASEAQLACCAEINIFGKISRNPSTEDKKHFLNHFVSYFSSFIYKKELLRQYDISFPPTRSAEDTCFLTCCLLAANKIERVEGPQYNYNFVADSVSHKRDLGRARQRLASMRALADFAHRNGLHKEYRRQLALIRLKKGYLMALKDILLG